MNLSNRRLWLFGAIAITAIIIVTLVFAPASNKLNSGSTYNRSPDGYGAWYAFMSKRGTEVQRWQKPAEDFTKNPDAKTSSTLLRIYSSPIFTEAVTEIEEKWLKQGNTLVILGISAPVTQAPFSSLLPHSLGEIKIDTGRRVDRKKKPILGDEFGGIVWTKTVGKGRVYFASAPYLAANAYQDFPGNYEFLAALVTQSEGGEKEIEGTEQALAVNFIQNPIDRSQKTSKNVNKVWVDEYIHGYKDPEIIKRESKDNLFTYLAKK